MYLAKQWRKLSEADLELLFISLKKTLTKFQLSNGPPFFIANKNFNKG